MANKNITENNEEAKKYLNDVEVMGPSALRVADRILDSNKLFIHNPEKQKEMNETIDKITKDYNEAFEDAVKQSKEEPESYEKHVNLANYFIGIHLEKTQKLISFWDRLNQKL